MARRVSDTLQLERNIARLPAFWPRAGVPLRRSLAAPAPPFHGEPFRIDALTGTLGPHDLVVLTHLCSLYRMRRPGDRRLEVDLAVIARWLGAVRIGGEQRRIARGCIERLHGATFSSVLRPRKESSSRFVDGWRLVDRYHFPPHIRGGGSVWLSTTVTELLDDKSVVYLDAETQLDLLRRSPIAHRLWVFLEADTLHDYRDFKYALFDSAEPRERPRSRAAIADMLRLADTQTRQMVLAIRRASAVINELDPRYELSVVHGKRTGTWNLVARRHKSPMWASQATPQGDPSNATRAPRATADGGSGNDAVDEDER